MQSLPPRRGRARVGVRGLSSRHWTHSPPSQPSPVKGEGITAPTLQQLRPPQRSNLSESSGKAGGLPRLVRNMVLPTFLCVSFPRRRESIGPPFDESIVEALSM